MVLLLHIISKLDRFTFRTASIRRKAFLGTRSPAGSRFDPIGMRAHSPIPISFKAVPADRTAVSGRFPSFLHFFPGSDVEYFEVYHPLPKAAKRITGHILAALAINGHYLGLILNYLSNH